MDIDLSDDDLMLGDKWLQLVLNRPQEPEAVWELLRQAADGATFAISDCPEMNMPWRRTIATRLHNGNQDCWRLTDSEGWARDEPQHGTPIGLTCDESSTEKSLTGDEWGEYYNSPVVALKAAGDAVPGMQCAQPGRPAWPVHALLSPTLFCLHPL
jgi:hypothetical protein